MNTLQTQPPPREIQRSHFGEILTNSISEACWSRVKKLVSEVQRAVNVDEHGSWSFGIANTNRRGGWTSLNWSLYGVGRDLHSRRLLAIVQVRQASRRKEHYFMSIRKNYFLVGRNEDGTAFAHPVSHGPIHAAIRAGDDVVRRVQRWIFGVDYKRVIRQGDLGLIPVRSVPAMATTMSKSNITLANSHDLKAVRLWRFGDNLYARNPLVEHQPGTHPTLREKGLFRVVMGQRAAIWQFARPTAD